MWSLSLTSDHAKAETRVWSLCLTGNHAKAETRVWSLSLTGDHAKAETRVWSLSLTVTMPRQRQGCGLSVYPVTMPCAGLDGRLEYF